MKKTAAVILGLALLGVLAFGAVKTLMIAPRTVSDPAGILEIYYETRSGLPPLPPPVDYKTVASQLSKDRFDFLATPDWAFNHSGGTLYLSEKSKLNLSLPMVLTAYEDLASGKVVLTGSTADSKKIETLAVVDAPEFAEQKSGQTLESWLMKEIGPRRIIWTAVLKPEEDAWADLLSIQEESLAAPMMMTMSVPETIMGFRIVQDGTNLSVNLPAEFAGAMVDLMSCTNLIEGVWSTVLQTNVASTGVVFMAHADIPNFICETSISTNWVNCPNHTMPGETCTNQTLVVSTNSTPIGGGVIYYRTTASSTNDYDDDGLDNVTEYDIGTDYQDSDSDDDFLTDGEEIETYGLDPLNDDTDEDGVDDGVEVSLGRDPVAGGSVSGETGLNVFAPQGSN